MKHSRDEQACVSSQKHAWSSLAYQMQRFQFSLWREIGTGAQRLTGFKSSKSTTVYPWCRVVTRRAKDSLSGWSCVRHPLDSNSEESLVIRSPTSTLFMLAASGVSKEATLSLPPRDRLSLLLTSPLSPPPRPRCPLPVVLKRLQKHRAVVRSVGKAWRASSSSVWALSSAVQNGGSGHGRFEFGKLLPNIGLEISVAFCVSSSQYDWWLASNEASNLLSKSVIKPFTFTNGSTLVPAPNFVIADVPETSAAECSFLARRLTSVTTSNFDIGRSTCDE